MSKLTVCIVVGICVILIGLVSCSHTPMKLDYKKYNMFSSDNAGNDEYTDIGPVHSNQTGFVWDSCKTLALAAVKDIVSEARSRKGNGIINVKWEKGDGLVITPTCTTRWGWVWLVIPALGPWMKTVTVSGTMVKIKGSPNKHSFNIHFDEKKSTEEIASDHLKKIKF